MGQEDFDSAVDERFVGDEAAHGEGVIDAAAVAGVVSFVLCAEHGFEAFAFGDGLLDWVEVGLRISFVQPIYILDRRRIRETQDVWTDSNNFAILPVQFNIGVLASAAQVFEEAPPVRIRGEGGSRISLKAVIEFVAQKIYDE